LIIVVVDFCVVAETLLDNLNNTDKGLDIDQRNDAGQTILHICAINGCDEMVALLIGMYVCDCV
jgi:ankyrin repeat protein